MIRELTRDELKQALDSGALDHLFDARSEDAFEKSHIKGAESLPAEQVERGVGLPQRKDAAIVFYCTDPGWKASSKAARAAVKLGYTNIGRYPDGIKDWMKHRLPVERNVHKV